MPPRRIGAQSDGRLTARDVWMVVHRSKQRVPKIRALMGWLAGVMNAPPVA